MLRRPAPPFATARREWRHACAALLAGAGMAGPADAVILQVTTTGDYAIALQVGQATGVSVVSFSVPGASVGQSTLPVAGTPAIDVSVTPVRPDSLLDTTPRPVKLTVNSSTQLACQSGSGCGTATIPFSKISWTASANSAAASGDIQSGQFSGSTAQQISAFNANAGTALLCIRIIPVLCPITNTMSATRMTFSYANDTIYPAGIYTGRVIFTASME